jgi:hypothetical protein
MSNESRSTYDKPRRSDAVGLLTMLRKGEKSYADACRASGLRGMYSAKWRATAMKHRTWARWVKAVLDSGGGGE